MRIKLTISYDGTDFVGWQRQNLPGANNRSVQGELERQLRLLLHQPVSLQGAGRTDAGVMASGQVVGVLGDLLSCGELIEGIVSGAERTLERLARE